jgi:hypothetical protein
MSFSRSRYGGYGGYGASFGRSRFGGGYDDFGYGGGFGYDFAEQMRRDEEAYQREVKRQRLRELERQAAGSRRRQVELEKQGGFTPAGVWDADCEKWPEYSYSWDLGGGLVGTIQRGGMWCWCGYVTLPEWYPNRTKAYNFWNAVEPRAPVHKEFSYGGGTDILTGQKNTAGKYGWDHTWGGDLCPFGKPLGGGAIGPNWGDHARYSTAEMVIDEVWLIASWFASMALDGSVPVEAITEEVREGLFRVQQGEMRIAERKRKEREVAAAAARAEQERVAAEAAARAAAEAERQRLWDLEHPLEAAHREAQKRLATARAAAEASRNAATGARQAAATAAAELEVKKSRLPRVQDLLALIAELEHKDEELSAAEQRQLNRKEQLQRELANRAGDSDRHKAEELELAKLRAAAEVAEAAAVPLLAACAAADAEVAAAAAAIAERDAALKAAEEAAARRVAARAELELKQKRLGHVIRLLGEIDAIRARRDAGDKTLEPLQLKKATRLRDLEKERADLEAQLAAIGDSVAS